ncbi:MAG: class I SAM-dependent methyltransferase [Chloroflexi bacterium]|nr:class I SAM-dependent methyltransferase [Chloroflexota bacterium]
MPLADPRKSFDPAAEIYDEIRPSYPAALFDDLFALLPPHPRILEVGPGTGQATRDLLRRGAVVQAIELGPGMAAKLSSNLPSDALRVTVGDFEQVAIPDGSMDAVFSATAYHWISRAAQLNRPAGILGPGGILAIVDLNQVDSPDDDGFFATVQPVYERHGQRHTGPPVPPRHGVDPAIRTALDADRRFVDVRVRAYDWNQTYTAAGYRKLMLSYSVTQMMRPEDREGLLGDVEAFIEQHYDGQITRPLVVTLTTARLA